MAKKIKSIDSFIQEILSDQLLTRAERRSLTNEISTAQLNEQEQVLLLSKMRDEVLKQKLDPNESIEIFYDLSKALLKGSDATSTNPTKERAVFSPGTACREMICSAIRFAQEHIDICVFTISDNVITEEILRAHSLKKKIRIITDNDKTEDMGSDIEELEAAGIQVTTDNTDAHMHHKFALFDRKKLITGSYNWTRSAALYNHENLLETTTPKLVDSFHLEFERLWKELN
jgi:phosphatidylserine/phosphatidylglycerophosphate/cardiolipin synthase-like enzyme